MTGPRRHRWEAGRCPCGAVQPKPGHKVPPCTRPQLTATERAARSTAGVKAFRVRAATGGTCRDCTADAEEGPAFCPGHRTASLERGRARNRRAGRPVRYACPCGVPGHYVCPTGGEPPR